MKSLKPYRIPTRTTRPERKVRHRTTPNIDRAARQSNLPVQLITIIIIERRKIPVEDRRFQRITITIDDARLLKFLDTIVVSLRRDTIDIVAAVVLLLIRIIPMLIMSIIIIIIIVRVHRDIVTIVDRDTSPVRLPPRPRLPRHRVAIVIIIVVTPVGRRLRLLGVRRRIRRSLEVRHRRARDREPIIIVISSRRNSVDRRPWRNSFSKHRNRSNPSRQGRIPLRPRISFLFKRRTTILPRCPCLRRSVRFRNRMPSIPTLSPASLPHRPRSPLNRSNASSKKSPRTCRHPVDRCSMTFNCIFPQRTRLSTEKHRAKPVHRKIFPSINVRVRVFDRLASLASLISHLRPPSSRRTSLSMLN